MFWLIPMALFGFAAYKYGQAAELERSAAEHEEAARKAMEKQIRLIESQLPPAKTASSSGIRRFSEYRDLNGENPRHL